MQSAKNTFPAAIKILEEGLLDLDPLITHCLPLEEVHKGMALMTTGEGMEIIIQI